MKEQPTYYAVIPADVRYDKNLTSSEKLFYGEITCLTHSTGYCWASNSYFADLYGVKPNAVTNWVTNLKKHGYISVRYEMDGKQIKRRIIKLNNSSQYIDNGIQSNDGGSQYIDEGYSIKGEDNNTSNNNIKDNNIKNNRYYDNLNSMAKKEFDKALTEDFDSWIK